MSIFSPSTHISSSSRGEENTMNTSLYQKFEETFFSLFYELNRDSSISAFFILLYMVIDAIQMLRFPINPFPSMPWSDQGLGSSLFTVLQPLWFQATPDPSPSSIVINANEIYIISIVWTILFVGLFLFAMFLYSRKDDIINGTVAYKPSWPLRLLRIAIRLTVMALFVPALQTLLTPLTCTSSDEKWANTNIQCFSGTHSFYFSLSIIFSPFFILITLFCSVLYLDRKHDRKKNPLSQAHGHVSGLMVILKTILCFVFTFGTISGTEGKNWPLQLVAIAAGLIWLFGYAAYAPYCHQLFNEIQCSFAGVYISASIAGLLSVWVQDRHISSTGVWVFLFTFPPAAFVGWAISYVVMRTYSKPKELTNPYAVELRVRWLLSDCNNQDNLTTGTYILGTSASATEFAMRKRDNTSLQLKSFETDKSVASTVDNATHSATGNQSSLRSQSCHLAQLLYEEAVSVLASSALLECFASTFFNHRMHNRHLEMLHLRGVLSKADTSAIDLRFFAWERYKQLEEEEAASNSVRTSVARRMHFDKLQIESENLSMRARTCILDFWTEASDTRPDMFRLEKLGMEIITLIRQADNCYRQLLELAPQSIPVLRKYADFLLEIANNPRKAMDLLHTAEQIEEDDVKSRSEMDNMDVRFFAVTEDFDLSNDNVSVVRIDATPGKLGIIVDANPAACKLFGYMRREIVGKSVNTLIPPPMCHVHQRWLQMYMASGVETVVNTSRILFAMRRDGIIVPTKANIRAIDTGFGGVFEELQTTQGFIIFLGEYANWRVTAICKLTHSLLSIQADDVENGVVTMKHLLPDVVLNDESDDSESEDDPSVRKAGKQNTRNAKKASNDDGGSPKKSPLMEELITSDLYSGQGVNIKFQVLPWAEVAAAQRAERQRKANKEWAKAHRKRRKRGDGYHSVDSEEEEADLLEPQVIEPLKHLNATAKLQEVYLSLVSTPVYVLRWRLHRNHDDVARNDLSDDSSVYSLENQADDSSETGSLPTKVDSYYQKSELKVQIPVNKSLDEDRGDYIGPVPPMCSGFAKLNKYDNQREERRSQLPNASPASVGSVHNPRLPHSPERFDISPIASIPSLADNDQESNHVSQSPPEINQDTPGRNYIPGSSPSNIYEPGRYPLLTDDATAGLDRDSISQKKYSNAFDIVTEVSTDTSDYEESADNPAQIHSTMSPREVHEPTPHTRTNSRSFMLSPASNRKPQTMAMTPRSKRGVSWVAGNNELVDLHKPAEKKKGMETARVMPINDNDIFGMAKNKRILEEKYSSTDPTSSKTKYSTTHDDHDVDRSQFSGRQGSFAKTGRLSSRQSQGSQSHVSSSVTDALRKGITVKSRHMETSLKALRRAIFLAFLVISIMNIVSIVVSYHSVTSLKIALNVIALNGRRAIMLESIASEVQELALMSIGKSDPSQADGAIKRLGNSIEELASLHQELYYRWSSTTPASRALNAIPSIDIIDLEPGTYQSRMTWNSTTRKVNFMNAVIEFIAKARLVHARPYDQNAISEPTGTVFWILENSQKAIRMAMHKAMTIAQDNTAWQSRTLTLANHVVLGVAISSLALVTVLVMIPAIGSVLRQKHQVFEVFLNTPLPILKSLRAQAEAKITALRRAAEEADAGLDIGGAGDANLDDSGYDNPGMSDGGGNGGDYLVPSSRKDRQDSQSRRRHSNTNQQGKKPKLRKFRHMKSVKFKALAAFLWPIVLLCAYYFGTWWWMWVAAEEGEYGKNEVFQAHLVESVITKMNFLTRDVNAYCEEHDFVSSQYISNKALITSIDAIQDALMTGDDVNFKVRALLKTSPKHFHLFMVDGCIPDAPRYDLEECYETFDDGLVGKGLLGAYKQYIRLIHESLDDRNRDIQGIPGYECANVNINVGRDLLTNRLAEEFLSAGFREAAKITSDNISSHLSANFALEVAVTIICIACLALFYLLVYSPLVKHFDKDIKNVRYLLLLFPDELSRTVPAITNMGRELLKDGNHSSNESVASSGSSSFSLL